MENGYRVMKFGGASVGTSERLLRALDLIAREWKSSPLAVVVSAMGDTTDWLIEAARSAAAGDAQGARAIAQRAADLAATNGERALESLRHSAPATSNESSGERVKREVEEAVAPLRSLLEAIACVREQTPQMLDSVVSFGERLSAAVLTELLIARGLPALLVDSRAWTVTDDRFGNALVDWEASQARIETLREAWRGRVVVTTGFLGQTRDGRTTTLGRNGSDYTATLLARALHASEVDFWTDVPGVMTADPALVADAYPLTRLSYMEALELANFGARLFHPRTMIPLIESGIPLRIRNTLQPDGAGTLIDAAGAQDSKRATSVTSLENLALLDIECRRLSHQVQLSGRVLSALDRAGITASMATQSAHGQAVAVVVPMAQVPAAQAAIQGELALQLERKEVELPRVRGPITLLTLVAEAMGQTPNVAGRFFQALGGAGINVHAIAQGASARSVSCAIDAADTAVAVRTVHATFHFAHEEVNLALLGHGTVGSELLAQIQEQHQRLKQEHGIALRVVGLCDSRASVFEARGLDLDGWASALKSGARVDPSPAARIQLLEQLQRLPLPILVDCTAAEGMELLYREAFQRGVHVVSANKKPLSIPWAARQELMASARRHHRAFQYETTVGASLPVIETLKDLIRTGDEIQVVEGSLSGTLGFLSNELMRGVPLSRAMAVAKERGYTEPRPQDDLSGMDVARKALILAREIGLPLSIEQISVEPFVPADLIAEESVERFFERLAAYDSEVEKRIGALRSQGRTLRYLARIEMNGAADPGHARVRVGPVGIDPDHPATRLRGAEAFIAFTTDRYQEYPLIVQGAGAGGAVTAAGVLADIFKVAQRSRGS
jgi:aspartokinase/homoserine dehydrogenase 1